jgi:hypothetical protein
VFADSSTVAELAEFVLARKARGRQVICIPSPYAAAADDRFRRLLRRVDAVVTTSEASAAMLRLASPTPVWVVPLAANQHEATVENVDSDGPCRLLAIVDARSSLARANPSGLIDAYRTAFSAQERGRTVSIDLVLKHANREWQRRLSAELESVAGQLLLDPTPQQLDVLIAECDVYIALARAEALDGDLDKALVCHKPVVIPGFLSDQYLAGEEVALVGYVPLELNASDLYLDGLDERALTPGQFWNEPSVTDASQILRALVEQPIMRARLAERSTRAAAQRRAAAMQQVIAIVEQLTWIVYRVD